MTLELMAVADMTPCRMIGVPGPWSAVDNKPLVRVEDRLVVERFGVDGVRVWQQNGDKVEMTLELEAPDGS